MGAHARRVLQHVPWAADDAAGRRAGGTGDATRYADDAGVAAGGAARDAGVAGGRGRGDNVYRPPLDFLTASSHTSTAVETQFTGDEIFSVEELLEQVDRYDATRRGGGRVGAHRKRRSAKRW